MRHANCVGAAFLVLMPLAIQAQALSDNICALPLRSALMTVKVNTAGGSAASAATAWQCSFKFSSHDEAIKAGLDVDTVVYGVPLKVGGKFDKKVVDQWRDENCSKSTQNASFESSSYGYLREVAPGAMKAYEACLVATYDKGALTCELTREPALLKIKWKRVEGELPSAAPKIQRITPTNGSCEPMLSADRTVLEGGVGTTCTAQPKRDMAVLVETDRGMCAPISKYPRQIFSVVGSLRLDSDRQVVSDVIEFQSGSVIITNGNSLTLTADEVKIAAGGAQIVSFDSVTDANRVAGTSGRNGGALLIKANRMLAENDFRIDLRGQNGVAGLPGGNGGTGAPGTNARGRGLQGIHGCGGGNDSTPGAQGGAGTDGKPGGPGGNGGVVVVQVLEGADGGGLSRIIAVGNNGRTLGGRGGVGGSMGIGGAGGPGGSGDSGNQGCGGRGGSGPGPKGPDGLPGPDGPPGASGSISIS